MLSRRAALKHLTAAAVAGGLPRSTAASPVAPQPDASRSISVAGRAVEIHITPATPITTRITVVSRDASQAVRNDGSLVDRSWPNPSARVQSLPFGPVRSGDLTLSFEAPARSSTTEAFGVRVDAKDRSPVQRLTVDSKSGAVTFALGEGPVLGLGEGGPQFDRRGSADGMRSGQGGYQLRTHGARVPIAWLIGTSGWALFFHEPTGKLDLTGENGRFDPADASGPIDIFITASKDPVQIMAEYAHLTGFPAMPPMWALGYQQSHRTLAGRDEILDEARTFRAKRLPCDALIYLGTGFCPSGWNTDNGEFTFNPRTFPDPDAMIRQLHDDHFKVVLHVVLEGRTLTGTVGDRCSAPALPSGRTADGHWPDKRQVSCYWPFHKPLMDAGVDGLWPDQGDGLDASSRLARIRMYWDGLRQWRPNERPYALHRNGAAGMQRYGAFLWSGDVYSRWETLETHVPVAINSGLSGIPLWGTDIGGFVPTKELTGELYVRWFQFGAFCPLFRAHGRTWKLRLPWGWNTGELGPDEVSPTAAGAANPDPSELHNAAVEPICRKYLELRYRLLPYLYTAVRESHDTGLPIVRALWLHYPADKFATSRGDEYLWGRDMLVAPVTRPLATSRRVYLPAGRWYDFWTEAVHAGGGEIERQVDLETMPLFVRAGAIVPLAPVRQYTSQSVDEPLTVQLYPGGDGLFTMYDDDGVGFEYERGDWMGIRMRWLDRDRRLDLSLAAGSRMRSPDRRLRIRVVGSAATREVTFSGRPLTVQLQR